MDRKPTAEEKMVARVESFYQVSEQQRGEIVLLGIAMACAVTRVGGDGVRLSLGDAHWDVLVGAAMAVSGCRGPVELFSALVCYSAKVSAVHLNWIGDEDGSETVARVLSTATPQRVMDVVRAVTAALAAEEPTPKADGSP
jgi:hypothetical protein